MQTELPFLGAFVPIPASGTVTKGTKASKSGSFFNPTTFDHRRGLVMELQSKARDTDRNPLQLRHQLAKWPSRAIPRV